MENPKDEPQHDEGAVHSDSPPLLLPSELLLLILSFLSVEERCRLEEVCTHLRNVCRDPATWRTLFIAPLDGNDADHADLAVRKMSTVEAFLESKKPRITSFTCQEPDFSLGAMSSLLSHSSSALELLYILYTPSSLLFLFQHLGQCVELKTLSAVLADTSSFDRKSCITYWKKPVFRALSR